jgi:hypothetical protein
VRPDCEGETVTLEGVDVKTFTPPLSLTEADALIDAPGRMTVACRWYAAGPGFFNH